MLLGKTAEELSQMKLAGDDAGYEEVFGDALFKSYVTRVSSILIFPCDMSIILLRNDIEGSRKTGTS